MSKQFISNDLNETNNFAKKILLLLEESSNNVLILSGDLGSGKTTFTQALGKNLNITKNIKSPTFSIFKTYSLNHEKFNLLCHVDAYRLNSANEIIELGILDYINDESVLTIIEWPEKITEILIDRKLIEISIEHGEKEDERIFNYSSKT